MRDTNQQGKRGPLVGGADRFSDSRRQESAARTARSVRQRLGSGKRHGARHLGQQDPARRGIWGALGFTHLR